MVLKILVAEDIQMVRGAFVALLGMEPDLCVVAEVGTGDAIVATALEHRPDVAVIDIDLAGIDGLTAAEQLHAALPSCRTLILTGLSRPGTLRRAVQVSVAGFMLKASPSDQLATAVRNVAAGLRVIDPQLAACAWNVAENPLSSRERQILRLTAEGAEAPEIACTLHLSVGTVRNYLTRIVSKLGARNRVDAVRIATDEGWVP